MKNNIFTKLNILNFHKKLSIALVFILVVCCMTACGERDERLQKNEFFIYYIKGENEELIKEKYKVTGDASSPESIVEELLVEMAKNPSDSSMKAPLNKTCKVKDFHLVEGKMSLNFEVNYNGIVGVEEILHRSAIVKTLTQIEGIDSIEFLVDEQPLLINKVAVGYMTKDTFIESVGETAVVKTANVSMYYANQDGTKLVEVPTKITYDSSKPLGTLMIEEVVKGPSKENIAALHLQNALQDNMTVNAMTIRDSICYIDVSKEFTKKLPSVAPEVSVYAIVNLLVGLPNVNKVQFSVNGEQLSRVGNIDFSQAFERNLDIIEQTTVVGEATINTEEDS